MRDAALLASLAWGSQKAWIDCQRWAFDPAQPCPLATLLTAALGTRADHEQLLPLLHQDEHHAHDPVRARLRGKHRALPDAGTLSGGHRPLDAKLAAQCLGLIFGFAPAADESRATTPGSRRAEPATAARARPRSRGVAAAARSG